jgi:hypothetical protein
MHGAAQRVDNCEQQLEFFTKVMVRPKTRANHGHPKGKVIHCIVSNFRLHRDSHSQILTATETPSAPTLARSNLVRLSSLD